MNQTSYQDASEPFDAKKKPPVPEADFYGLLFVAICLLAYITKRKRE